MTTIPTIQELKNDILNDLQAEFSINIPIFGRVFLRALATVQAGKLWIQYKYLGKVQKNIWVDTAEPGEVKRWGVVKMGRNPFPATQAKYKLSVTGTVGATIPASTTFKSDDSSLNPGKLYILDVAYTLATSPDLIIVRALEAGKGSQLNAGDTLTATAPIILVDSAAAVDSEDTAPQDSEDIEDYRNKTIVSFRLEPQGGAPSDYRIWALDAQGIVQAYPYAASGDPNVINLYVEASKEDSLDNKGTPTATQLSNVADVIEFDPDTTLSLAERGRRPLGVHMVNVLPVDVLDVDISIASFVDIDATKKDLITNSVTEMIDAIRPFIGGADVLANENDILDVNKVIAAILAAVPGAVFGTIGLSVDGTPTPSYTFDNGKIPFLNPITYI